MINFLKTYKTNFILGLLLVLSILLNGYVIKSCSDTKSQLNNNIIALTDSIKYHKTKTGEVYVSKTLLDGDLSTLKLVNDSLAQVIKDMRISDPSSVVYINNIIENEVHDTTWIAKIDTLHPSVQKDFAFNNEFRVLEGNVSYADSTLGLHINKDLIYFDYIMAIENNKVYLKSNNPYVKFNEVQGITIPKAKPKWSLGIGPHIGYGYDFVAKKSNPYVGIGINLNYNLINW